MPIPIDHEVTSLTPAFGEKVKKFFADARSKWYYIYIFESRRTLERQYELFGKWRTVTELAEYGIPATYAQPDAKQVTWTLLSNHLTGNAIDVVFDIGKMGKDKKYLLGYDPKDYAKDWKKKVPSWEWDYLKLFPIAQKYGIRNIYPTETCHFENDI